MSSGIAAAADAAFVDEQYEECVRLYTQMIDGLVNAGDKVAAEAHSHRAAALLKLGQHDAALEDATTAARVAAAVGAPQLECIALYRKGAAFFALDEYEAARTAFRRAKELSGKSRPDLEKTLATWLRKCEAELADEEAEASGEGSGSEADSAPAVAAAPVPASQQPSVPQQAAVAAPTSAVAAPSPAPVPVLPTRQTYNWYQSATHVTVTILAKDADASKSDVKITETQVDVSLALASGSSFVSTIDLFDKIVPGECTTSYRPTKVELKLRKASPYNWPSLERAAGALPAPAVAAAPAVVPRPAAAADSAPKPSYPSSSKKSKDWSAVEKEITQEESSETPEGEEALQKLFRQIYGNADEDTRRAMIKSFQTSGGTVLSTNWGEVASKDYEKERQAPDGMKWQKWG